QGDPAAVEDARREVASEVIGPEGMRDRRRLVDIEQMRLVRVVWRDERRGGADDRERGEHEHADERRPMRAEALEREAPLAARRATQLLRFDRRGDRRRRHQEYLIRGSSQPYITSATRFERTMKALETARMPWSTG